MNDGEPRKPKPFSEKNGSATLARDGEIRRHIQHLLSDDFHQRAVSTEELERYGKDAASAIVDTLLRKAAEPHAVSSLTEALEEIGKPSVTVLIHALDHIVEVRKPAHAYLLENLVDTLGCIGDRRAAAPLARQLQKLNDAIGRNHQKGLVDICESVKVRIHGILAELDDRSGSKDLLRMLGDGRRRVRDGVVQALGKVGDRRALVPLLRLYTIEDDVSLNAAGAIQRAMREIARRERVGSDDAVFRDLAPGERAVLAKLFPKTRKGMRGGGSTPRSGPRAGDGP